MINNKYMLYTIYNRIFYNIFKWIHILTIYLFEIIYNRLLIDNYLKCI